MKKLKFLIGIALLFFGALQVEGQTTVKSNPGPPTIPASITYIGNEAEIAFSADGILVYNVNTSSPVSMQVDFGTLDIDQLNAGKYIFHINSNRSDNVTIVVKGIFTKNSTGISNNLSGIVGVTNTGTGTLRVSLENFEMPNLGAGTEDLPLKIIEDVGSTGPIEVYALNLRGRRYNFSDNAETVSTPGLFNPSGDGILNEFNVGSTNLGSGENTNLPITFTTVSLPITWRDISAKVVGDDIEIIATQENSIDVSRVEAQWSSGWNGDLRTWETLATFDPKVGKATYIARKPLKDFIASKQGGNLYFRFQSFDLNGNAEAPTKIASVKVENPKTMVVWPNPIIKGDNLNVKGVEHFILKNSLGQEQGQSSSSNGFSTRDLSSGIYFVISGKNIQRIIVQ